MEDAAPTWDLESICPGGPGGDPFAERRAAAAAGLAELHERIRALGPLIEDGEGWQAVVLALSPVREAIHELISYAGCAAAADSRSKEARAAEAAADDLARDLDAAMVDLEAALTDADDAGFASWVQSPELADARPWLEHRRGGRALRLDRERQALKVAMDREAVTGWGRLYDLISGDLSADLEVHGETRRIGIAELSALRADEDRQVRRAAHEAGARAWAGVRDVCAHTLTQITGARQQHQDRLGVDELAESLYDNRIERATLDALWAAADALRPSLVRYLERKAALLGTERLEWFDRDAPMPTRDGGALPWGRVTGTIVDAFGSFHPDLARFAQRALDGRWVDALPRDGRRQGGFCADMPLARESRIFMTFTGSMDNGMTLAHELGHAFHNEVLAERSGFRRDITSALAETASTFAEATFRDRVLQGTDDPVARAFMLDQELQAAVAFLMDIPARFQLERRLFALRREGVLDPDQLSDEMVACQRRAYGGALASYDPSFWCSKLHFYIPEFGFYNWPYTFGYLFSAAVYQRARAEGPSFMGTLRELLERTGWQGSEALARDVLGVDLTSPAFWIEAARPIEQRVEAFLEVVA